MKTSSCYLYLKLKLFRITRYANAMCFRFLQYGNDDTLTYWLGLRVFKIAFSFSMFVLFTNQIYGIDASLSTMGGCWYSSLGEVMNMCLRGDNYSISKRFAFHSYLILSSLFSS